MIFVAVVLDPRTKLASIEFWFKEAFTFQQATNMTTRVKELIIKLYDQYNVGESSTQVRHGSQLPQDSSMKVEENENDNLSLQFMNKFHKYLTSKSDVGNKLEVDRYLMEDVETTNAKFDILN
jgi:hypothetical protein